MCTCSQDYTGDGRYLKAFVSYFFGLLDKRQLIKRTGLRDMAS